MWNAMKTFTKKYGMLTLQLATLALVTISMLMGQDGGHVLIIATL